jgi:death-on-curing protein
VEYISVDEVVEIHRRVVRRSGGTLGIRDHGSLESSVLQPLQSFGDQDLYPTLVEKAAALGYFLIQNHPFLDGNKRVGHAALETVLILNGYELSSSVNDQEVVVLAVARGELGREEFTEWVRHHVVPTSD